MSPAGYRSRRAISLGFLRCSVCLERSYSGRPWPRQDEPRTAATGEAQIGDDATMSTLPQPPEKDKRMATMRDPEIGQDQVTADERTRRLDGRPFPETKSIYDGQDRARRDQFERVGGGGSGPCAPLPQAEKDAVNARLAAQRAAKPEPVGMDAHAEAYVMRIYPMVSRTAKGEVMGTFFSGWRAHARVAEADRMATIEANRTTYETRIRELEREIGKRDTDMELLEERIDELETDGSNR